MYKKQIPKYHFKEMKESNVSNSFLVMIIFVFSETNWQTTING